MPEPMTPAPITAARSTGFGFGALRFADALAEEKEPHQVLASVGLEQLAHGFAFMLERFFHRAARARRE